MKNFMIKFIDWLDIKPTKDQRVLLISNGIICFITAFVSSAMMNNCAVVNFNEEFTSTMNLISCVCGIVIGKVWTGYVRDHLMRNYKVYVIVECIIFSAIYLFLALCHELWNPYAYMIIGLIYSVLIGRFIGRSQDVIKSAVWVDNDQRERFNINMNNVAPLASLVGFILIKVWYPGLTTSLILLSSVCIIDDIGWFIVYCKNKDKVLQYLKDHKDI